MPPTPPSKEMRLSDLLRLADIALSGRAGPDLPEELLRAVVEETGSRAGVLRRDEMAVARWPRTVSAQVEEATDGWSEIPFGSDGGGWCLRLLHLERLDEAALGATRIGLSAWQLREELKRTKFDARFHLWELEAIRSIATGIGGILDTTELAEELISHLVSLLGLRSAHLYLGDSPESAENVGGFGPRRLGAEDLAAAWQQGIYRDDVVALPLTSDSGTLGVLVAADKEARAGTEPFAANDVRLLELFAVQVTVAMEYVRLTRESLERERMKREIEMAAVIQSHLHPQKYPAFEGYRLAARSSSSRQVAGDTYDVLLSDNQLDRDGHRCFGQGSWRRDDRIRGPRLRPPPGRQGRRPRRSRRAHQPLPFRRHCGQSVRHLRDGEDRPRGRPAGRQRGAPSVVDPPRRRHGGTDQQQRAAARNPRGRDPTPSPRRFSDPATSWFCLPTV